MTPDLEFAREVKKSEPGYSLREYLLTLRLANKLADLRVANANQSCDGVATLGENQQVSMTKNKNDSRMGVIFVCQEATKKDIFVVP